MTHQKHLSQLIHDAMDKHLIDPDDHESSLLRLCHLFEVEPFPLEERIDLTFYENLNACLDIAYNRGLLLTNSLDERDVFEARMMDCVMPSPREVKETFAILYQAGPDKATEYLYRLSKDVNYIKTKRLKENLDWVHDSPYGKLEMTINLAKPEKDPKDIAYALKAEAVVDPGRPQCVICKENEQNAWNARMNLRIVPITLGHELWHFQYSPYLYYNEHAIILHDKHQPMKITHKTFDYLFDFVNMFPTYFIGSNADLPIVGGSILSHDHFQAGRHHFPIEFAKPIRSFSHISGLVIEHLNWPMSTLRLKSRSQETIRKYACLILDAWKSYDHPSLMIQSKSGSVPHNTITPIARVTEDGFELDIILRNNRTTEKYPDGIFHPHANVHHIKKENIGLIEAMGLAILPGRLKRELDMIEKSMHGDIPADPMLDKHQDWMMELKKLPKIDHKILLQEVGKKFESVLRDAGVFKLDYEGIRAMHQFVMEFN